MKIPYKFNTPKLLKDREYGMKRKIGYNNDIAAKLYRNLDAYACDIPSEKHQMGQGGIFNLEFSLDGYDACFFAIPTVLMLSFAGVC